MKTITNLISRHQVAAFFMITFAITWGLGFSYIAVLQHGIYQLAILASLATCGPALAGILVTTVGNREPRSGSKKARWIAFLIALLMSTAVYSVYNFYYSNIPLSVGYMVLAMLLVTPPVAYIISATFSRVPAVRSSLVTLIDPRGAIGWSLISLVIFPCLAFLSIAVSSLVGGDATFRIGYLPSSSPLLVMIGLRFLYQLFFYNATGEEAGWTGFARPRLQVRVSPLITALIVTLF